jgi:hypothetical protein
MIKFKPNIEDYTLEELEEMIELRKEDILIDPKVCMPDALNIIDENGIRLYACTVTFALQRIKDLKKKEEQMRDYNILTKNI